MMDVETHKRHLTRIIDEASAVLEIFKEDDLEPRQVKVGGQHQVDNLGGRE